MWRARHLVCGHLEAFDPRVEGLVRTTVTGWKSVKFSFNVINSCQKSRMIPALTLIIAPNFLLSSAVLNIITHKAAQRKMTESAMDLSFISYETMSFWFQMSLLSYVKKKKREEGGGVREIMQSRSSQRGSFFTEEMIIVIRGTELDSGSAQLIQEGGFNPPNRKKFNTQKENCVIFKPYFPNTNTF